MNSTAIKIASAGALGVLFVLGGAAGAQASTPQTNPVTTQWESSIHWVNDTNVDHLRFENARIVSGDHWNPAEVESLNGKVLDRNAEMWTSLDAPFAGNDYPNTFRVDLVNDTTNNRVESVMITEFQSYDSQGNFADDWRVIGVEQGTGNLSFDYTPDPTYGPIHNATFITIGGQES